MNECADISELAFSTSVCLNISSGISQLNFMRAYDNVFPSIWTILKSNRKYTGFHLPTVTFFFFKYYSQMISGTLHLDCSHGFLMSKFVKIHSS